MAKQVSAAQLGAAVEAAKCEIAALREQLEAGRAQISALEVEHGVLYAENRRKESLIQMLQKRPTAAEYKEACGRDFVRAPQRAPLSPTAKAAVEYCAQHGVRSVDHRTLSAWMADREVAA